MKNGKGISKYNLMFKVHNECMRPEIKPSLNSLKKFKIPQTTRDIAYIKDLFNHVLTI